MKVLTVLLLTFALSAALSRGVAGHWNLTFSGNLAMGLMLCFTAIGHFKFTQGMVLMMPDAVPFKLGIVYATGVAEVLLGGALLVPAARPAAACILIAMFVCMLPANLHAAVHRVNLEKADYSGPGLSYLWFRIPLQVFFIAWLWYFSLRK